MIRHRIGPLVEPLHAAFETARYQLGKQHAGLCDKDDPEQAWLRTHNLRSLLFRNLRDSLPESWTLNTNHHLNGMVCLTYGSGEIQVRMLHQMGDDRIPIAGHNAARIAYYSNKALSELTDPHHLPTHRLIGVWSEPAEEEPFIIDVIRSVTPGRINRRVKTDLDIPLPRMRTAFEDMRFDTRDDDEQLDFDIDEKDLGTDE
ncbi:hypothetical protein [Nocardia asiatica]|uniref:hypothetical protein n=1 Tax=Nocardia asiatica TaxID=209252 RepID=UPI002454221E|nr:hypothetical protein [Nocardia asiatica]